MKKSEDELKNFFEEMQMSDRKLEVPDFDSMYLKKQRQTKNIIRWSIAASFLLAVSFYFMMNQKTTQPESVELVITLTNTEEINTQTLITGEPSMDAWTSPTSSLIDDF
jgi:hypothetical protein